MYHLCLLDNDILALFYYFCALSMIYCKNYTITNSFFTFVDCQINCFHCCVCYHYKRIVRSQVDAYILVDDGQLIQGQLQQRLIEFLHDRRVPKVHAVSKRWALRRDFRKLPSTTFTLPRTSHL